MTFYFMFINWLYISFGRVYEKRHLPLLRMLEAITLTDEQWNYVFNLEDL